MHNNTNMARVLRRMIGKVNVFDMSGFIKGDRVANIRDYIDAYVKQGQIKFAIVNIQELSFVDNNSVTEIFSALRNVGKTVLFYNNEDIKNVIEQYNKQSFSCYCNKESDVVKILGEELVNIKTPIPYTEKRSALRLKSAISTDVIYRHKNTNDIITTSGIITNISEKGAFVEYLDIHSASRLNKIDYFKNIEICLRPSDNYFISQDMIGDIVRIEISGNQTSVAVKFYDDVSLASLS
ncbi:hypothetical protein ACFL3D_00035 [Candidatus Omnitrophota bacterium]